MSQPAILQAVRSAWRAIPDPCREGDITARVQSLNLDGERLRFVLEIAPDEAAAMEAALAQCEQAASKVAGVGQAQGVLTAHFSSPRAQELKTQPSSPAPELKTHSSSHPATQPAPQQKGKSANREIPAVFSQIDTVLAVASGKGGVGKSTLAVNLAAVFAREARVGLLDADIYGPSAPQLLGVTEKPDVTDDKKVIPVQRFGIHTMSIGYMVPPEQAMVWRGPVVQSALMQMVEDVAWPKLDLLVLDLPPGTGDVQLTMAQRIPVTGALIVTTPQSLALADVRRAAAMLRRVEIPILGTVENMSYLTAPDGTRLTPFGKGGSEKLSQELKLPHLASLPLDEQLQAACDAGKPLIAYDESAPSIPAFKELAEKVKEQLRKVKYGSGGVGLGR